MMRRLVCLLVLGGCAEPSGPVELPGAIYWIEWPAAVVETNPGSVRVIFFRDGCSDDRLLATANYPDLTVELLGKPRYDPCPLRAQPGTIPVRPVDTTFALPRLTLLGNMTTSYGMRATIPDLRTAESALRTVGAIQVSVAADTTRYVAGLATLEVDSVGCTVVRAGFGGGTSYGVVNPPPLGGMTRSAFVGGHVVVSGPAACGQRRVIQLDFANVALVP